MEVWKMIFLFKQVIFRFHVNFPGCNKKCVTTFRPMVSLPVFFPSEWSPGLIVVAQLTHLWTLRTRTTPPMFFSERGFPWESNAWKTFAFPIVGNTNPSRNFEIPSLKLSVHTLQMLAFSKFGISKLPGGKPPIFRSPSLVRFRKSCDKPFPAGHLLDRPPDTFPLNLESCEVGMEFRRCEDQALVMKDGDLVMTLDTLDSYPPENQDSNSG